MGAKINSLFKSRRFWVAVAGVVIVLVLGSWIVGDALRITD